MMNRENFEITHYKLLPLTTNDPNYQALNSRITQFPNDSPIQIKG